MVASLGQDFASVSAELEDTPQQAVFDTGEPEVTVQAQIDPNMTLHQAQNAQFLESIPKALGDDQQGWLGDLLGAMEGLANDVAEVGQQVQQVQQVVNLDEVQPNNNVLDTSLTQEETKFTNEREMETPQAAPAPSMA